MGLIFGVRLPIFETHLVAMDRIPFLLIVALASVPQVSAQEKPDPPETSIWTAAIRGSVTLIEQHIAAGTDVDARKEDANGQTPLYYAAEKDRAEAVRVLLEAGADPNKTVTRDYFASKFHQGTTPLHIAVYKNSTASVRVLMARGADLTLADSHGLTVVDLVDTDQVANMLPALVAYGLSEDALNKLGEQLMQLAVDSSQENAIRSLLNAGADANGTYRNGEPLLIAAIELKDHNVSVALLMGGANPNATDAKGKTALEMAFAKKELKPLLRYFLGSGVNLTPILDSLPLDHALVFACLAGDEVLVGSLLKQEADPDYLMPTTEVNAYGLSGLDAGSRTLKPIIAAIESGSADVLKQLLDAGLDPQSVNGQSTIGLCLNANQPQLIPLLLDAGADPESIHVYPWFRTTVVHTAAAWGLVEALEHLINAGADVNLGLFPQPPQPQVKMTPLHSAIEGGQLETTRFLLENGANKNAKRSMNGPEGFLEVEPVILAAMTENIEIVDLLIEHGISLEGVRLPDLLRFKFNRKFLEPLFERGAVVDSPQMIDIAYQRYVKVNLKDPEELEWYLDNGFHVDGSNRHLETILHAAVKLALPLASFELLVEAGADVNAVNLQGVAPLTAALARSEDERWEDGPDVVDYLEEAGAEESEFPSFSEAIMEDNVEVLAFYLEKGVDLNYLPPSREGPPPNSNPPLVTALTADAMGCARLLVDKGADVNLYFMLWRGFTTPMAEMVYGNNVTGVQFLLEHGARVNPFENIPGALESLNLNDADKAEERLTILKLLIDAGADVNASLRKTPLLSRLEHSKEGHAELALVLLENGAIGYGSKELLLAAIQGHVGLLDWLLDHGVDPLGADNYHNTPLHFAAVFDQLEVAKRLVSTDTLAALNAFGETPIDMAAGDTLDLFESHNAPDGHGVSFWEAIRDGDLELVKAYEKSGMYLRVSEPQDEGNNQNLSPLMQAVDSKQSDIALYLIERHDNIFAEPNLMGEVRKKRLREVEKILKTKFRLSYRLWHPQPGNSRLSIVYAGFDYPAPYHLESSSDLKNWVKIEGTDHRFRDSPERTFNLDFPQAIEAQQFIRLRRRE